MSDEVSFTDEDLCDHVALAVVLKDASGSVLSMWHIKWGFWTIPLGKAHVGQAPEDGVIEEMREELGIEVRSMTKLSSTVIEYQRPSGSIRTLFNLYEVTEYDGKVNNLEPAKHAKLAFRPVRSLANEESLSDGTLLLLEHEGVYTPRYISGDRVDG